MPLGSIRASVYLNTILFFLIYIPSIVIINDNNIPYNVENYFLSMTLLMCFLMHILFSRLPLVKFKNLKIKSKYLQPHILLYASVIPIVLVIFIKVSSNFSIIGILDVYDKRDKLKELNLGFITYLIPWLSNFILPIIIANSLLEKKVVLLFACVLCYFFMFFTLGAKVFIIAPSYFLLSYYYLRSLKGWDVFVPLSLALLCILPLVLVGESLELIKSVYQGVINMRVFLIQGLGTAVYSDFFLSNPNTYFSHVSVISSFVDYPYSLGIPELLNEKYSLGNYNSPYFVSDGFSSYKYFGMLIMSFIVSSFFYLLDSVTKSHDYKFVILSLSVFIVSFSNASFATSLLSFGGLFFILYFIFSPKLKGS